MAARKPPDTFVCPICGSDVPEQAAACPKCGSDAATGWSESANKWEADIPAGYSDEDDGFDYDEYIGREFPSESGRPPSRSKAQWVWIVAVILLGIALLFSMLHG